MGFSEFFHIALVSITNHGNRFLMSTKANVTVRYISFCLLNYNFVCTCPFINGQLRLENS